MVREAVDVEPLYLSPRLGVHSNTNLQLDRSRFGIAGDVSITKMFLARVEPVTLCQTCNVRETFIYHHRSTIHLKHDYSIRRGYIASRRRKCVQH